jgi:hypothetical protein
LKQNKAIFIVINDLASRVCDRSLRGYLCCHVSYQLHQSRRRNFEDTTDRIAGVQAPTTNGVIAFAVAIASQSRHDERRYRRRNPRARIFLAKK